MKSRRELNFSPGADIRPGGQTPEPGGFRRDECEEDFLKESFDEDDPAEEFNEYYDSEEEEELIEEYERRLAA